MPARFKPISALSLLLIFYLGAACTINISSSSIPTSIVTLVKTLPPMATQTLETPTPEMTAPTAEPQAPIVTQAATLASPSPTSEPISTNAGSTPLATAANEEEALSALKPVFFLNTGSSIIENQSFYARDTDETCVYVSNGATLGLVNPRIQKTGSASSASSSQNFGLNSACLVRANSHLRLENPRLTTDGISASGIFTLGQAAQLMVEGGTLETSSLSSPGVVVAGGATADLIELQVTTRAQDSAGIKVGLGGSSLNIRAGKVSTSGNNSPCYVSLGTLFADGSTCAANAASIAEVDGASTIALRNVVATAWGPENGILLYRSGVKQGLAGNSNFSAEGGSLAALNQQAPLFYAANTQAQITLKEVELKANSGVFLLASANADWGQAGANGATVLLNLANMTVNGNISADQLSAVSVALSTNSSLNGAINQAHTARFVSLSMDNSSTWTLTGDSYINRLVGITTSGNTVQGIIGNGFTLYYDPIQSPSLGGNTFSLAGGGSLTPAN